MICANLPKPGTNPVRSLDDQHSTPQYPTCRSPVRGDPHTGFYESRVVKLPRLSPGTPKLRKRRERQRRCYLLLELRCF